MNDWYRQSPALRNGTAFPGFEFKTPEERIAFLEQQLAAAIGLVRQKDATEAACSARLSALYEPIQQRLQQELKSRIKNMERAELALRADVGRYAALRKVRVRAMQLGIDNLSGEALDQALDQAAKV